MAFEITCSGNITTLSGLKNFDIESILECGQCFRWDKNNENDYTGIVKDKAVRIVQTKDAARFYGCTCSDFKEIWNDYFDMSTDYGAIISTLTTNDNVMKMAAEFAPGIRILRQPLFETLISFIISANNSIPNIRRVIARLSKMYGEKIDTEFGAFYKFPDPGVLGMADVSEIALSKAGFRSKYIKKTAKEFNENPITTDQLKNLGYTGAKKELMKYPGVGAKVADCTLLFSGAYTNAFPVDVWVKKIMEELYLKKDTQLGAISDYASEKFGELGGYAQQYLFYYARSNT